MDTTARTSRRTRQTVSALCVLVILGVLWNRYVSAPAGNSAIMIHVSSHESLSDIADQLQQKGTVRDASVLKSFVTFFKSDRQIQQGDYLFESDAPVYKIAWQIAMSHHDVEPIKITFKEGITNADMANLLSSKLSVFDPAVFLADPQVKQGYMFPDTYFFYPLTTTQEVIDAITADFKERVAPLQTDIASSGKSESDIITMASLIEKEAEGESDAPTISGILWKRIALGMPLQVDAAPSTYTQKGLPAQPINNPGLVSINAALHPIDSPYLFYLHDKNGMVHYATTFAEHKANIAKYLR